MKRLYFTIFLQVLFLIILVVPVAAQSSETESYKLGISDVIEIKVLDHPDLRTVATVAGDGSITFPFLGTLRVKDMSMMDIEALITKGLQDGYVKYPVVSVSLIRSMSKKITTYGYINRHGEFPFEEGMSVVTAIATSGGLSPDGLYGEVTLRRKLKNELGYKDIKIDLYRIVRGEISDTLLQPNDIVIVERNETFLIEGEVANRGRFVLERDMTVLRALLQAGGVNDDGYYGVIKVRRKAIDKSGSYKDFIESKVNDGVIEDKNVEATLLQPDDIVVVERNETFLIEGEVANRGRFVLERDMTVLRALLQAGGVNDDGSYGTVKVRRKEVGASGGYKDFIESKVNDGVIEDKNVEDILLQPDDIVLVERNETFLIEGEVANRGRFVLEKDMAVLRALLQAGGVNDDGSYGTVKVRRKEVGASGGYKDFVESKVNDGVIEDKNVEDTLLQPDDIVLVERNKTFFIYGEANKTGEFVLKNDMTVFNALTIAGGITKWGSESRVKILRHSDQNNGFETIKVEIKDVVAGNAGADVLLKPNDTIVISSGVF